MKYQSEFESGFHRGDIWLSSWGAGHVGEPTGTRPAVIVSADMRSTGSVYDLIVIAPFSATLPGAMSRPVVLPSSENGLATKSVVVVRALRGVAPDRLLKRVGRLDGDVVGFIDELLVEILGLDM